MKNRSLRARRATGAASTVVALLASLLAAAPLVSPPAAEAATKFAYYSTFGPSNLVPVDTLQVVSVTIQNTSTNSARIGSARITLPEEFSDPSVPEIIYSSKGKKWTASIVDSVVSVAVKGGGLLPKNAFITVPITTTPTELGGYQLPISAWKNKKFRDTNPMVQHLGDDASVAVSRELPGGAVVVDCGFGTCDTEDSDELYGEDSEPMPQSDIYNVYAGPGEEPSVITAYVEYTPDGDPLRMSCQSVDQVLVFDVTGDRPKEITDYRIDMENTDVCYGQPTPWEDYEGLTKYYNPDTGLYEGFLDGCTENPYAYGWGGTSPCISSIDFVDSETWRFHIMAAPGDPRITN
ncbi:hypothetical protein F0U44_16175 [Nocardioides humilatus]|uniref:Uncharacterized protein n=1 Tax=Nocardioides humilatus TaxID=2607660 RepID=A0A5B1LDE5_9ACTN|nr:hypothetical protein [Nocardioides humilatus]KAA1417820.1 hypothetical protein F0U44_16175 [Nocardioides humilatus]